MRSLHPKSISKPLASILAMFTRGADKPPNVIGMLRVVKIPVVRLLYTSNVAVKRLPKAAKSIPKSKLFEVSQPNARLAKPVMANPATCFPPNE